MSTFKQTIKSIARHFETFTARGGGIHMRRYQLSAANAIIDSVINNKGLSFVVIFPRQSGKDELISNLLAFLCLLYAHRDKGIVVANPTYKPQTINAILRFEKRLQTNLLTRLFWSKRSDFMRMIGECIVSFLSGDASANVVGAVASLLLVINEAQDIEPGLYDKRFAPMVASTNATRVFAGTTWTSKTLLAREMRAGIEAQKLDGIQRVFLYTADDVRKRIADYGIFVDGEVAKLGRQHPLIKTQYYCEEIDAIANMFNAGRLALIQAPTIQNAQPEHGHTYCITIDVGGQDEAMLELDGMSNPGRDYVQVDVIDVDMSSLELMGKPAYHVVKRLEWHGQNHVHIFGALKAIAQTWNMLYMVIDATGVGEGLWGMCSNRWRERVIPVKFTQQTKSEIGYAFLGIVDTGRFRDHCHTEAVHEQYENCTSEVLIGPAKTMRWGVKDGTRGPTGELIHDDCITADSLVSELDKLEWYVSSETAIIEQPDVLQEMDNAY